MNKCNKKEDKIEFYDTYIIDLVQNYYYIFNAWVAYGKYQKFILSSIQISTLILIILGVGIYFYYLSCLCFGMNIDVLPYLLVILLITWIVKIFSLILGFFILSPDVEEIKKRLFNEFNTKIDLRNPSTRFNFYVNRFEIEKIWIKLVLVDNQNIDNLINIVSENLKYRKPTSRGIETIINNILKNPYIVNSLVIFLTVSLTISLSPIVSEIDSDNFSSVIRILNGTAFSTWLMVVILFLTIKFIFMAFEWAIENSNSRKQLVLWRYEIFLDMLARHQQVKINKPKIRCRPEL